LRQKPGARTTNSAAKSPAAAPAPAAPVVAKRKRSFKEQHELEQLPKRIEQLEGDIAAGTAAMNQPNFFQQDSAAIVKANEALAALQAELDAAYARWSQLDG
jgi:ATP-binding cassette subfamily F protein uup